MSGVRAAYDPGSFRDRNSRVFYSGDDVFRGLGPRAAREWEKLSATGFFRRFVRDGKVIATERVDSAELCAPPLSEEWAAVVKHQRIPFISYPYEWSFEMLRDAALLQLELLDAALQEGMILKDSSAFNFQWVGAKPVLIDIGSFETLEPGTPWVGYRQFCQLFLYPLLLQAYKGLSFQPWLRGCLDGIEPAECDRLMSKRDLLRPGVFKHVYLQSRLQQIYGRGSRRLKTELKEAGFRVEFIEAAVRHLRKLVDGLTARHAASPWSDYSEQHGYSSADEAVKADFVRRTVGGRTWNLAWDLGCNLGQYARIAAAHARYVVAMDADPLVVDILYRALKAEGNTSILPMVGNVTDPSPGLGWRGQERRGLTDRGKPDLTLCLALVHHLVISGNVPLPEVIEWLATLQSSLVIEFVSKDDPMVQRLLRNKDDQYPDYDIGVFETWLSRSFQIVERASLQSGTRVLYFGHPRI